MDEKTVSLFLLPVRRKLLAVALAYLTGVALGTTLALPEHMTVFLGVLLLAAVLWRRARRKDALFCVIALALLAGCWRSSTMISVRDMPSQPGVMIKGTVAGVEKPYRVRLRDVTVGGQEETLARDVMVTLMLDEQQPAPQEPLIGQHICGTGRLFAPDEKRNPGGMDERIRVLCEGYELSGYLLPGWQAEGEGVFSPGEAIRRLRLRIVDQVLALFGESGALLTGVMLGDRSELDKQITASMRLTGIAHVLTVSGLHLSMIAGAASRMLGKLPLRRKHRFAAMGVFLLFFTCLTGAAPGTIRAFIMVMLRELAILRGRRYEPLTALAFAALCMTLAMPLWLLHASFQFSFFVVLGIQMYSRSLSDWLHRRFGGRCASLADLLGLSLSAQIGSVPMQLLLYGYVPLLSLPMNVLCSMVMPFLLLGGWAVTLLSFLLPGAAVWPARLLAVGVAAFERLSVRAASMDGAILRLPSPLVISIAVLLALFLVSSTRIRLGSARRLAAWALAAAAALSYAPRFHQQTRYVQLDVGQGDAAVICSGRKAVLVDVGPADSYDALRYLRHEGLHVGAVILTHLDEDHAGALNTLLSSEVSIPAVIMPENAKTEGVSAPVATAMDTLAGRGIALHEVKRGDRIEVCGAAFDVLSPDDSLSGSNERSLLLDVHVDGVRFLLAGDLPSDCEPAWVPDADVLKVAHHGGKSSTSDAFLAMAKPEAALISVSASNRYGHPHARVLQSLDGVRASVWRTDKHGCITLYLADGMWRVETFVNCPNGER